MSERIRSFHWTDTALGPVASWSPALRMMVRFLLANRFPLLLWWGPHYVSIYNDAYRPILGAKHPRGLGQPVSECWSEIWHVLRPLIDTPYRGGPATWNDDILLEINRHGFVEETHFTIAYSPVPDESVAGGIGGVLATVHEITDKIVAERRVVALRDLGTRAVPAKTGEEACAMAAETLARHAKDVPFALLYLMSENGANARLAGAAGVSAGTDISPLAIDLQSDRSGWDFRESLHDGTFHAVSRLQDRFKDVPVGPWSDAPTSAVVVSIPSNKPNHPVGVMIVGLSARLKFDDYYRDFLELVRTQVATTIANARTFEEERRRAEALAEVDRAKTAFFGNVSHEFRTPLTLMLGPLEEMRARASTAPALVERGEIDVVHRNSLRLLKLVNTLLDFSRIEAGRTQASFAETDLARLTAELASVFRSAMAKAALNFTVDCPPLPQPVFVDADLWEKIVFNLLSNALKFTLRGEVSVTLGAERDYAVLRVRDTGLGIAPAEMPNLFKRFHRIDNVRSRTHEGTGIGLALAQELVKLHGGAIEAESEPGHGTEFRVRIPFGRDHLPPALVGSSVNKKEATVRANGFVEEALGWLPEAPDRASGRAVGRSSSKSHASSAPVSLADSQRSVRILSRVLLAEDNADMRDYVRRLLSEHYDVEAVPDGAAAFEAARHAPPDVILSDVMMPKMNGLELVQRLRADEQLRATPIILLSARAGEEARVEGAAQGADDYLTKPFSARELLARVAVHLELARVRQRADAAVRSSEERFRAFVTTSSNVVYRMSADWKEMRHLVGQDFIADTPDPSRTWLEKYIHPDDQSRVLSAIQEAIRNKTTFELEHRVIRVDGTLGWVFSRAIPLLDSSGKVDEWFGTATDVTERKRAEQALRESEARYRALFDSIDEGFCVIEFFDGPHGPLSDYVHVQANPAYERHAGIPNVVGQTVRQMVPGEADGWVELYRKVLLTGQPIRFERELVATGRHLELASFRVGPASLRQVAVIFQDVTPRKKAEQELRKSRERFDIVKESTQVGFWFCDLPFDKLEWDYRVKEHFWLPPDAEITIEKFYDRIHPDDREPTRRAIELSLASKMPYETEYRTVSPDGQVKWIRAIGRGFYDESGQPLRFDGLTLDITARKLADEALREGRERLQAALNGSGAGTFRWNIQTNALEWDENLDRLFGLPPGQTIRSLEKFIAVVHPDERPGVIERCTRCAREGADFDMEFRVIWPDGSMHWLDDQGTTFRDEAGRPLYMTGMCIDITERKRAEELLRDSEAQLAAATIAGSVGTWAWEIGPNVLTANPALAKAFGMDVEQVRQGLPAEAYVAAVLPEDRPAVEQAIARAIAPDSDGVYTVEYRTRDADGKVRWLFSRGQVEFDADRKPLRMPGALTDVTDRKQADEALRAAHALLADKAAHLEDLVQQRTAKLRETIAELEAFSYSIAHDMRAPLRSLHGFSDALLSDYAEKLDAEGQSYLRRIAKSAARMDKLIQDVLSYSRVVRGEWPFESVDVEQLLRGIADTYPMLAPEKADIVLEGEFPRVLGSEAMLMQIFSNLLGNAVKFVPAGRKPHIRVWAETRGERVRLFVRDNGIGIAPEEHEKIFDIFHQVGKHSEGTGIGLAIVRKAAERMGGTVTVESQLGAGTTFRIDVKRA